MNKSFVIVALGVLASAQTIFPATANQISQFGITWTFDKSYEIGQFVTGDWWVVGPATITTVSPAPTPTRNGTCVNPKGGRQGYDDRADFNTADRVAFPYTLQPDQSMVSSVSKPDGPDYKNIGCLQSQAVLTAVTAAPVSGTFRPAYAGTYKKYFNVSRINWAILPSLPKPASAPLQADLIKASRGPRIDHLCNWTIQYGCAENNWFSDVNDGEPCYGREVSYFVSDASLYVMLDVADRNPVAQNMMQIGIDNYGVLKAGGGWAGNGGHHSGRKWPIVFAAKMLNDTDMLNVGVDYAADGHFGEEDETYYGANGKALWGVNTDATYFLNGCSGSGDKVARDPAHLVDGCADYRSCCTTPFWIGQMLSALMLNAKSVWNHNAYFDFVDRWMTGGLSDASGAQNPFVTYMWNTYRNSLPQTAIIPTPLPRKNVSHCPSSMMYARYPSDRGVRDRTGVYDLYGKRVYHITSNTCVVMKQADNHVERIIIIP
jgi:hypothetical protein